MQLLAAIRAPTPISNRFYGLEVEEASISEDMLGADIRYSSSTVLPSVIASVSGQQNCDKQHDLLCFKGRINRQPVSILPN